MNKRQLIFGALAGVALAAIPTTAAAGQGICPDENRFKPYDGSILFPMRRVVRDDGSAFVPAAGFKFEDGFCAPSQEMIDDLYAVHGYTLRDFSKMVNGKGIHIIVIQDKYMFAHVRR